MRQPDREGKLAPPAPSKEQKLQQQLQRWAEGKATLKDVRGYSDEELFSIARIGYNFYYQGKIQEARTLFQGLYAVNPLDPYFARALGVVELAAKNPEGAMAAYDVAIKLAPSDPSGYVGRAEVRLSQSQRSQALEDLKKAAQLTSEKEPLRRKIFGLLAAMTRRSSPGSNSK